jgi:hypothetical protein
MLNLSKYFLFVIMGFFLLLVTWTIGDSSVNGGEIPKKCNPIPNYDVIPLKLIHPRQGESGNLNTAPGITPQASSETTYTFTGTLAGSWDSVVGYICFPFKDKIKQDDLYACIIGLRAESIGNDRYQSVGWNKKVFWLDVGDRAPMHVCGIYYPNCVVDGVAYDNVYWAPNFMYLPPEANLETGEAQDIDIWMSLNDRDEVEKVWVNLYGEDADGRETVTKKQLAIGDRLLSFTPVINLENPNYFYGYTMEETYQTVKKIPVFSYTHLTPNVDFVNPMTKDYIDFEKIDLLYVLFGEAHYENSGVYDIEYSYPLSSLAGNGLKWGDSSTKTENWFVHEATEMMKFWLP